MFLKNIYRVPNNNQQKAYKAATELQIKTTLVDFNLFVETALIFTKTGNKTITNFKLLKAL